MFKYWKGLSLFFLALLVTACSDDTTPLGLEASQDQVASQSDADAAADRGQTIAGMVVELAQEEGQFTALLGAVQAADPIVLETLSGNGQFTVFAPTDEAFAALAATGALDGIDQETLTDILLYHVSRGSNDAEAVLSKRQIRMMNGDFARIDGAAAMIDNANIIATDIEARNGVIHVIDAVLLPPEDSRQGIGYEPTIFDLVAELGDDESPGGFSTLRAAVLAAGDDIVNLLDGSGQFTVFAPNNQAFETLIADLGTTPEALLADGELLQQVLSYHVTRGRLLSEDVVSKSRIRMLDGNWVEVDGPILNGDVEIIGVDNETGNGVVHVIGGVLLPPA